MKRIGQSQHDERRDTASTVSKVNGPISTPVEASGAFHRPRRTYIPRARDLPSAEGRTPRVRLRPACEPKCRRWSRLVGTSSKSGARLARPEQYLSTT